MELQARILHHLRRVDEPCNVVDLAHGLGILEPGDVVPNRLRSALTALVLHQQVRRVHNGDGVLRYVHAAGAATAPKAITERTGEASVGVPEPPLSDRIQPRKHRYQTGVSERVYAAFVPGAAPVQRSTLEDRLDPPLSSTQVLTALMLLRTKGLVERVGSTSAARWVLVDRSASHAAQPAASAPPGANRLESARAALLKARLAVDAALQALGA